MKTSDILVRWCLREEKHVSMPFSKWISVCSIKSQTNMVLFVLNNIRCNHLSFQPLFSKSEFPDHETCLFFLENAWWATVLMVLCVLSTLVSQTCVYLSPSLWFKDTLAFSLHDTSKRLFFHRSWYVWHVLFAFCVYFSGLFGLFFIHLHFLTDFWVWYILASPQCFQRCCLHEHKLI